MGTASIHEGVRRMRFSDLLDRTEEKKLTQAAAAELLGINVRTFQRWAERYEAERDDELVDLRMEPLTGRQERRKLRAPRRKATLKQNRCAGCQWCRTAPLSSPEEAPALVLGRAADDFNPRL
jgi:hypothetical protein